MHKATLLPPAEGLAVLEQLRCEGEQSGFDLHVLEAHAQAARVGAQVNPARACWHAEQALRLADVREVGLGYRGEVFLNAALAWLADGQRERALDALAAGLRWVHDTAQRHVPAEFQESFLHRNAMNRDLFALAARPGVWPGSR